MGVNIFFVGYDNFELVLGTTCLFAYLLYFSDCFFFSQNNKIKARLFIGLTLFYQSC